ncbi:hypothetical protein V8C42DRAFT_333888 [Trichoderma barbatum]
MAEPSKGGSLQKWLSYFIFPMFMFACLSGLGFVVFTTLGIENGDNLQKLQDGHKSDLPPKLVTFSEHPQYKNLSREYDYLWDELLTPNGGFIMKKDEKNIAHQYGLSMFHQLHCLAMIRAAMQDALNLPESTSKTQSRHKHHAHKNGSVFDTSDHWLHCFDYLRQTILCEADSTIEPPKHNSKGQEVVNGMGERQCRDWTILRDASIKSDEEL